MFSTRALIAAAVCCLAATGRAAENELPKNRWPAFQGPAAANVRAEQLPLAWSPEKNVAWRAPLPGHGQSSPVVWGERVFVTSISGNHKEHCHVTALALATGEELWRRDFNAATRVENTNYTSKAAPTPVVDAAGVVVLFESGNLAALDFDGDVRWQKNLVQEYGEIDSEFGLGGSLAQSEDQVFVWIERATEPYLLAVDKQTGEVAWKAPGLKATSWSTPVLFTAGGKRQLVLGGDGVVAGYDLKDGRRLWTFDDLSGNTVPTPRPAGEGRLLIGATVGHGGKSAGKAAASNGLLAVRRAADGKFEAQFQWRCKRATSSFGSPLAHRGLAYFVNRSGVLFCLDLATGEELYVQRLGDSIWATPLAVEDRIYFAGKDGATTVLRAGREFQKLAENHLLPATPARVQYAIAAVPGRILIRAGETLYCVKRAK